MNDLIILYEDNHLIVVVKPCNILVQPDITGDIDMMTKLKSYIKEKYNKPGDVYLGLVHRLDRMVGGVMVFARTSKAASRLSKCIRERKFKKKYVAIINGRLTGSGGFKNYLVKNNKTNMSRVVNSSVGNSKEAILEYNVVKNIKYKSRDYSFVDIDLKTGRHHQIRVQFANKGYPLYGDIKYGQKINKVGQNLALWSYYLSFDHPTKNEFLEFKCTPLDIKKLDCSKKIYNIDNIWMV